MPACAFLTTLMTSCAVLSAPVAAVELDLAGSGWLLSKLSSAPVGEAGAETTPEVVLQNASVPGGIWDNLHRAQIVGDPLYRKNDVVYANLTTQGPGIKGWTFTKIFDCPEAVVASHSAALLEFGGLQTLAEVTLNEKHLLSADNMFRYQRAIIPPKLLKLAGNVLTVEFTATPKDPGPEMSGGTNYPAPASLRDENDAWGWDWSPDLDPISIWKGPVRIVAVNASLPYLSSWSPKISVLDTDTKTQLPTRFLVNASFEFVVPPTPRGTLKGWIHLVGDWGGRSTTEVQALPPQQDSVVVVHASIEASVPEISLWWPLHYGEPHLHNISAIIDWSGAPSPPPVVKSIGFRSVGLYTGPAASQPPQKVDPAHAAAFVGCYKDGNPYWGGRQHALPLLAGASPDMTVGKCIALCAHAGPKYTLAGVQPGAALQSNKRGGLKEKGTSCYCGSEIGTTCDGCLRGVGTLGDPGECVWPCGGDPSVACGGGSYMWGANSVYNVTAAGDTAGRSATAAASPSPPAPGTEGSGDSAMVIVVNGVHIFSRGANLVPFELLEATVKPEYIKRTIQSVHDGGLNMLRVWGGGIWQDDLFYEECDRQGILLFHDSMFSMRLYPVQDAAFRQNVVEEIEYQVGRLMHHPAIVLWDSSNENDGDPAFYYDVVLTTIAKVDGSRPLWPASPSSGFATGVDTATGLPNGNKLTGRFQETLDTHMPYHYCDATFVTSTRLDRPTLFKSEFGQESLPAFETLSAALNGSQGDFNVASNVMVHRKHAGTTLSAPIVSLFGGDPESGQSDSPLICPKGQKLDVVAAGGDNGSCDCVEFCASDWKNNLKAARPHWTGATTAVPGSTTACQCVQATHWCPVSNKSSGCSSACDKVGQPKPSQWCVPDANPPSTKGGALAASTTAALRGTSEADFRRVIYLSQLAQTLCIKSYLEELRRGNHTMGSLIWQLNDVWQASSWGSLDYGGRWRALHHNLQTTFAPTVVSVWVDNSTEALHVYASHHGASPAARRQVEVNVTTVATGGVTVSKVMEAIGTADGSTAIRPLLTLPLAGVDRSAQLVTTRLVQDDSPGGRLDQPTVVVHPLLPPAEIAWAVASSADVTLHVAALLADEWQTVVSITNNAATPLFYALLTTTFEGRFDSNLLYVPPHSSRELRFAFFETTNGSGVPTKQEFEASLHVDWLNRGEH